MFVFIIRSDRYCSVSLRCRLVGYCFLVIFRVDTSGLGYFFETFGHADYCMGFFFFLEIYNCRIVVLNVVRRYGYRVFARTLRLQQNVRVLQAQFPFQERAYPVGIKRFEKYGKKKNVVLLRSKVKLYFVFTHFNFGAVKFHVHRARDKNRIKRTRESQAVKKKCLI